MGCILSRVHAIDKVNFNPFPRDRAPEAKKVCCKGPHHSIFILTPTNGVYTNSEYGKDAAIGGACTRGVSALHSLGVITKKEMEAHFAYEKACEELRNYKTRVLSWLKTGVELGVLKPQADGRAPLPKATVRRIRQLEKAYVKALYICNELNQPKAS